jgi:predicted RNA-binding protein YlxR (DUF448 family)
MMMDATGRLAGRGAYLCDDPTCRRTALSKNILSRALGVPLSDDLRSTLELEALGKAPERSAGMDPARMVQATNMTDNITPGGTIGQE